MPELDEEYDLDDPEYSHVASSRPLHQYLEYSQIEEEDHEETEQDEENE